VAFFDTNKENFNSIVLALTLEQVSFILSDDCEADNWDLITGDLPGLPGLDVLPGGTRIAMSSHIRPYNHRAPVVIQELANRNIEPFRTDLHYHLTFSTKRALNANGRPNVTVHWSHL
jgi:beta-lactamase superfamily II metal-dependent hydrolase